MEHLRSMWRQASKDVVFNSVSDDPWRWDRYSEEWPPRNLTQRTKRVGEITMHLVDYGDDREIYAKIGDRVVGTAYFGYVGADLRAAVQVDPKYRRRGVATAMYVWAEEIARDKLTPDIPHTPLAEALWNQPNRPFGRTASLSEGESTTFGQFRLVYTTEDQGESKPRHTVTAWDGSTKAGWITWLGKSGEVWETEVYPQYRRRGLATAMWRFAQDAPKKPQHSKFRTDDGDAWARTTGDPLPRRQQ